MNVKLRVQDFLVEDKDPLPVLQLPHTWQCPMALLLLPSQETECLVLLKAVFLTSGIY